MSSNIIVENAKIMSKGQVTIPKDIREIMGVNSGDRISFIYDGDSIRIMNSAVYAMRALQKGMEGEWEKADIESDDDIMDLVKEVRSEIEGR